MRYKLYKEQNKLRLNKNQGKEKLIMKAVLTMFSAVLLAAAAMAAAIPEAPAPMIAMVIVASPLYGLGFGNRDSGYGNRDSPAVGALIKRPPIRRYVS